MSGFPGRLASCSLYLYPQRWTIERTTNSTFVLTLRMRDIRSLRSTTVRVSITSNESLTSLHLQTPVEISNDCGKRSCSFCFDCHHSDTIPFSL